jgi:hypothetical protein
VSEKQVTTMNSKNIIGSGLVLLLVALLLGVWPTRYKTERVSIGMSPSVFVRIDRFTGKAEMLTAAGWHVMDEPKSNPGPAVLPPDELRRVEGIRGSWCAEGQHFFDGTFCVDLYNGSHWRVQALAIDLMTMNADGQVERRRRYELDSLDVAPFSYKRLMVNTADKPRDFQWSIVTMKGKPDPSLSAEPRFDFSNDAFQDAKNPKKSPDIDFGQLRTLPDEKPKR